MPESRRFSVIGESIASVFDTRARALLAAKSVAVRGVRVAHVCRELEPSDRFDCVFVNARAVSQAPTVAVYGIDVSELRRYFVATHRGGLILFDESFSVKECIAKLVHSVAESLFVGGGASVGEESFFARMGFRNIP